MQRSERSFIKNGKERKDRNVLLKRTDAQPCMRWKTEEGRQEKGDRRRERRDRRQETENGTLETGDRRREMEDRRR